MGRRRPACLVCGDPHLHAMTRCQTCYRYHRRTGHDRPFELISRLTAKDIANRR